MELRIMFLHIIVHSEADPWEGRHFFVLRRGTIVSVLK